MTPREFLENALGIALFLAFCLIVFGAVVLVIGSVPLLLALFPLSAALVGAVLLIAYLRHRRQRRRGGYDDDSD